jgi:hypothetical protein
MACLGLHNKPKAEVHPGHLLTSPKEEEKKNIWIFRKNPTVEPEMQPKKYIAIQVKCPYLFIDHYEI